MDVLEIIKEAIYYPTRDLRGWGIVAAIFLITGILGQLALLYPDYSSILGVLSFVVIILLIGINLSIIKSTIDGKDEIPMIDLVTNFVDGIKYLIVNIVYFIIPVIVLFIISIIAGVYNNLGNFLIALNNTNMVNSTPAEVLSAVPTDVMNSLVGSLAIVALCALVLFIIFELFFVIAQARLADTGDIMDALNFKTVYSKISSIGWGNYIVFILLLLVIIFIVGMISGLIELIPYIGRIISSVLADSYLLVLVSRAIGLIYNEGS